MKTLREIMLDRHRQAEAKLDAVRERTLARMCLAETQGGARESAASGPGVIEWFREFLRSLRWHLAGMSAVWLAIAFLNMDRSPAPTRTMAKQNTPSPRQLLTSLRENRRQLLEMIESPVNELVLTPRTFIPPRRSEVQSWSERAGCQRTSAMLEA